MLINTSRQLPKLKMLIRLSWPAGWIQSLSDLTLLNRMHNILLDSNEMLSTLKNITHWLTYGQSLLKEQWTFLLMCEHLAHIARTQHSASGSKLCHLPYCVVSYPFLTWHPLIAWLPVLSSPLSGGFCHAASPTSPPFSLIEIQLGTQTMPISWQQILERAA